MSGSLKPGFFIARRINIYMKLFDKILSAVDDVKFKLDDLVLTAKLKAYDLVDFVKYDVLKKDEFSYLDEQVEEKPKKKKKKTKKKKK